MFFVSSEFARKYLAGEEFGSTLDEVVAPGETLFPEAHESGRTKQTKAQRAEKARERKADD
jgi:hypothetical protein